MPYRVFEGGKRGGHFGLGGKVHSSEEPLSLKVRTRVFCAYKSDSDARVRISSLPECLSSAVSKRR